MVTRIGIQQNTHRPKDANGPHARHPDESPGQRGVRQGRLCFLSDPGRLQCGGRVTRTTGSCSGRGPLSDSHDANDRISAVS